MPAPQDYPSIGMFHESCLGCFIRVAYERTGQRYASPCKCKGASTVSSPSALCRGLAEALIFYPDITHCTSFHFIFH